MIVEPSAPRKESGILFAASDLEKRYAGRTRFFGAGRGREVLAVDGVSFRISHGETLGLVGETGSGKTTTGRLVARLEDPTRGAMLLEGDDWLALSGEALRRRRRDIQVVFQDPQTSLNPRMRVGDQVAEPLRIQRLGDRREAAARVVELMAEVGLAAPTAQRFPAELSGGQRQRVAIARALATRPRLLVCDEPVSALDVSVAAQVINLFMDLRDQHALSYLFISHDLAVVRRIADRIAVMYRGRIVEEGPAAEVTARPLHPYTVALLSAVPDPNPGSARARVAIPMENGGPRPEGCAFAPRCPIARPRCAEEVPALFEQGGGRRAACFYPGELRPGPV